MGDCPHQYDSVSVWQGKDYLDARARIPRDPGDRIGPCIKDIASRIKLSHPGSMQHFPGLRIAHLHDTACHAFRTIERRQGYIQLLKTTSEQRTQSSSEWSEEPVPLGPGIQVKVGCPLIEIPNRLRHGGQVAVVLQCIERGDEAASSSPN